MRSDVVRTGADWLALREPADAAARSRVLVADLCRALPPGGPLEIHDLGCGSGAMARWLAPLVPGPQRWVLHDRDADLLALAAQDPPGRSRTQDPVSVETRHDDVTRLGPEDLRTSDAITASALLDMMDAAELDRFVLVCARAGCPVLVTLSVVGRVELTPATALDDEVMAAFNAHQRRTVGGRTLLGPDAAAHAAARFAERGHVVTVRPSPWRLGRDDSALVAEWLTGWVSAAAAVRPDLRRALRRYLRERRAEALAGSLAVTVHHEDLLALPPT